MKVQVLSPTWCATFHLRGGRVVQGDFHLLPCCGWRMGELALLAREREWSMVQILEEALPVINRAQCHKE